MQCDQKVQYKLFPYSSFLSRAIQAFYFIVKLIKGNGDLFEFVSFKL